MRLILIGIAALLLSGCSQQTEEPVPNPPPGVVPFRPDFIPAAQGLGNFEVCLTADAKENGITKVTIPANILLQSWGQLVTDLRERRNSDPRAISGERGNPVIEDMTAYAVITTRSLNLSAETMCGITTVRSATNDNFGWIHNVVPESNHFSFIPYDNVIKGTVMTHELWGVSTSGQRGGSSLGGMSGDAIAGEYFSGVLLDDAMDPVRLTTPD